MSGSRARIAAFLETDLRERILPYWRGTVDEVHGGYRPAEPHVSAAEDFRAAAWRVRHALGAVRRRRPLPRAEKHVVTQSRILWTLSLAHRLGYGDGGDEYRSAADHGYRFLTTRLLDPRHGGYAWKTDLQGRVIDPGKALYGQGFALYALVEYHRATGLSEPLAHARELFRVVQERMHDDEHGGWIEHFAGDFGPLAPGAPFVGIPEVGLKSGNAHLHWMEALSELVDVTGEPEERSALEETLRVTATFLFPPDPAEVQAFCEWDWTPATNPVPGSRTESLSYGHNVEFAWLMLRAHEVLGTPPLWDHFDALVRHALAWGFDPVLGGFYDRGACDGPATRRDKIWWVQAEGLAALSEAVRHRADATYAEALDRLLAWILQRQRLSSGLWAPRVDPTGRPRSIAAPGAWKGGYHEVRAMVKFLEATSGEVSSGEASSGEASSGTHDPGSAR
ncbi:MAG: AGE family epimerase/isomerase [Gemmatimonadota bacterium]